MGVPADHHWSICVPLPIAKQKKAILFVCLSWHPFRLRCGCLLSLSLSIPYGMHLVVLAQLCPFGWYVIPTGHFSQKSPSRNLKIGFLLSPPPNHALWPITSPCLVLAGYRLVRFGSCACLSSMYVQNLHAAHASAVVGLHSLSLVLDYFLISLSFMACPIRGWALLDDGLCFFFRPPFFLLPSPAIPLYHFCCEVVLPQSSWTSLGFFS